MVNTLLEMLSFPFVIRALAVGVLVSLCAALLGVSLVLKRYAMIGDGLSHVGFGSLAVAAALNIWPLSVSIPVVVFAAFLLLRLSESSKIKGDAAIALISTGSLAVGVTVVSMSGLNTDIGNYLFGSIFAVQAGDVPLSVGLSLAVLLTFVIFYHKIFAVTFDEAYTRAVDSQGGLYNTLLALLTAVIIVLGMRVMGALLISGLIIFPALTSMRLCKSYRGVTLCAAVLSVVCFLMGMCAACVLSSPPGASVVLVNIAAFFVFWLLALVKKRRRS